MDYPTGIESAMYLQKHDQLLQLSEFVMVGPLLLNGQRHMFFNGGVTDFDNGFMRFN